MNNVVKFPQQTGGARPRPIARHYVSMPQSEYEPRPLRFAKNPVLACFDPQWPNLKMAVAYFEMVMCITQPINGTERLPMSLRPTFA